MDYHPIAKLFPMMGQDELTTMAADIKEHGLHRPIVLLDGMILDGRNRYEACKISGIAPRFVNYDGDDPYAFVWSENAERMTPFLFSQRNGLFDISKSEGQKLRRSLGQSALSIYHFPLRKWEQPGYCIQKRSAPGRQSHHLA